MKKVIQMNHYFDFSTVAVDNRNAPQISPLAAQSRSGSGGSGLLARTARCAARSTAVIPLAFSRRIPDRPVGETSKLTMLWTGRPSSPSEVFSQFAPIRCSTCRTYQESMTPRRFLSRSISNAAAKTASRPGASATRSARAGFGPWRGSGLPEAAESVPWLSSGVLPSGGLLAFSMKSFGSGAGGAGSALWGRGRNSLGRASTSVYMRRSRRPAPPTVRQ